MVRKLSSSLVCGLERTLRWNFNRIRQKGSSHTLLEVCNPNCAEDKAEDKQPQVVVESGAAGSAPRQAMATRLAVTTKMDEESAVASQKCESGSLVRDLANGTQLKSLLDRCQPPSLLSEAAQCKMNAELLRTTGAGVTQH